MIFDRDMSNNQTRSIHMSAVLDILPLAIAVIPWGILCGSLAIQVGLTPIESQLMSLLVFAGAAQLSALSIIGISGGFSAIFGSTAVVSSRHLLYSATFRNEALKLPFYKRIVFAFLLTDEMFAVAENKKRSLGYFSLDYALISGFTFYLIWNLSTFTGIVAGSSISNLEELGLEFAIAATFIAMVVPNIKSIATLLAVLVSSLSSIIFHNYEISNALLFSGLIGMFVGFFIESKKGNI
ncbi:branched-chain amino acid ABC transporter permease [Endozoicomonas sp. (ex Bugula neritina AB1)]|nr:branched-chain amino acid ABC transporter permease [Endozoicomonas sp. (ex Bugula neritina AB1)]